MIAKQPPTLYHYTSSEGLVGIVQQKRIWGTEIRFLNDSQEFEYALAFTLDALKELRKKYKDKDRPYLEECRTQLADVREKLADTGDIPIFVCSFSSKGNLLSQWRGYCGNGNGFSLGFDFERISALAQYHNLSLAECLYHETEQMNKIKSLLAANHTVFEERLAKSANREAAAEGEASANGAAVAEGTTAVDAAAAAAGAAFVQDFLRAAPTLKDPRFKEESEWRLTSFDPAGTYVLHFRSGKSMLIPYVEFPLTDRDGCFPLSKIYVGPTPLRLLSRHSVKHLLEANGIAECDVQASNIPYRSW